MIPIFDSLAHPTLTGRWRASGEDASFARLAWDLEREHFLGACAVGIWDLEGYEHEAFLRHCHSVPRIVPIAGWGGKAPLRELAYLARAGYRGVKLHPRLTGFPLTVTALAEVFEAAEEVGLAVFLCTYFSSRLETFPSSDPFYTLVEALKRAPGARVVLAHGGGVEVLRYAELARYHPNVLLDLSFTICRYEGSSIDLDLKYLCATLDQRICIGSDFPEIPLSALRRRFEVLTDGVCPEKRENVAHRNIMRFLGLEATNGPC